MKVYADNAATTQMSKTAINAMLPYFDNIYGNPSSLYTIGQEAKEALEDARNRIAACLGCTPREITFTSGGSEADNQAIRSAALNGAKKGKKHIITTAFEHHAVLHTLKRLEGEGFEVTYLDVRHNHNITAQQVKDAIRPDTCLVTTMYANNEIGSILPIPEIGEICREAGVVFHTDAVQAAGHVPINVVDQHIDMLSLSGHKFRGPRGTGVLYVKKGITLEPLVYGGGQERGMRPGTEAVPNIAAFAKACEIRMAHFDEDYAHVQELADYLKQQVSAELPDAVINGEGDIPHVVNLSMPGCKSEVMLHVLEGDEVYISSGSACSKGKQSGVLKALGLPKARTDSALRVSFAPFNTKEDVDAFVAAVKKGAKMFRR